MQILLLNMKKAGAEVKLSAIILYLKASFIFLTLHSDALSESTELCKTYRGCGLSHVTQFSLVVTFRGNGLPVSSVLSGFCAEDGDITLHRNIRTLPKHTASRAGSCSCNTYKAEPSTCTSLVFSRHFRNSTVSNV